MNKYKIGEIAASTGISSYTLKYYEKEGLLTPHSDQATGYRYYDVNDLGAIMLIHRHRQWGFSLKDISTLFKTADEDRTEALFAGQIQANQAEIARLQKANRALVERLELYHSFTHREQPWTVTELPSFRYLEHCAISDEMGWLRSVQEQMEDSLDAYNTIHFQLSDRAKSQDAPAWGLLRFDRADEAPPPHWSDSKYFIPAGPCLTIYLSSPSIQPPSPSDMARSIASEKGFALAEDAYALYLNSVISNGQPYYNFVCLFPLKK